MSRGRKKRTQAGEPSLKARWLAWYAGRAPVFRFALSFGISLALLYILLSTSYFDRALYAYLEANAWLVNAIFYGLGQQTQVSEVTIQSPLFVMKIQRGCDAVEPTWLLCSAMIAFPSPLLHKMKGILVAIVLLQVLNL